MKEKESMKNGYASPEISEETIAVEAGFAVSDRTFGTSELTEDAEDIQW